MKFAIKTLSMALCAAFVFAPFAASSDEAFDAQGQVGLNPVLPDIQQYFFRQMHLSSVVGWKNGEKPTVAAGLKIEALANYLQHPRSLYTLPNGDVPPQPITRPKDLVMRFIEKGGTSGGDTGPSNRITLLRYDATGGTAPTHPFFSTISILPSAWSWLVKISTSPIPAPSSAIPTTPATSQSPGMA
jgi:glucose/arabinose dehydrogenase